MNSEQDLMTIFSYIQAETTKQIDKIQEDAKNEAELGYFLMKKRKTLLSRRSIKLTER